MAFDPTTARPLSDITSSIDKPKPGRFDPSTAVRIPAPNAVAAAPDADVPPEFRAAPVAPPGPTGFRATDVPKEVIAGALHGTGAAVSGIGDFGRMVAKPIVGAVNAVAGSDVLPTPTNAFEPVGAAIQRGGEHVAETESDAAKEAKQLPIVTGDITKPSTLAFGEGAKSPTAIALGAANLLGEAAPMLIGGLEGRALKMAPDVAKAFPEIAAKIARGEGLTAAETATAEAGHAAVTNAGRRALATGAALGGLQGAESSAEAERQRIEALPDTEISLLPGYQSRITAGMKPEDARKELAKESAESTFAATLPVATAAGAVGTTPLLHDAQSALSKVAGEGVLRRAAVGAGAEAAVQAPLAVAQNAASIAAANAATGEDRDLTEGSAAMAGSGAALGGVFGGFGAATTRPVANIKPKPVQFPDARPGSMSDAANAMGEAALRPTADDTGTKPGGPPPAAGGEVDAGGLPESAPGTQGVEEALQAKHNAKMQAKKQAAKDAKKAAADKAKGEPAAAAADMPGATSIEESGLPSPFFSPDTKIAGKLFTPDSELEPKLYSDSTPETAEPAKPVAATSTEEPASSPPDLPWANKETGEFTKPTDEQMRDQFHRMFDAAEKGGGGATTRTAATRELAEQWGVSRERLITQRRLALDERNKGFRAGDAREGANEPATAEVDATAGTAADAVSARAPDAGEGQPAEGAQGAKSEEAQAVDKGAPAAENAADGQTLKVGESEPGAARGVDGRLAAQGAEKPAVDEAAPAVRAEQGKAATPPAEGARAGDAGASSDVPRPRVEPEASASAGKAGPGPGERPGLDGVQPGRAGTKGAGSVPVLEPGSSEAGGRPGNELPGGREDAAASAEPGNGEGAGGRNDGPRAEYTAADAVADGRGREGVDDADVEETRRGLEVDRADYAHLKDSLDKGLDPHTGKPISSDGFRRQHENDLDNLRVAIDTAEEFLGEHSTNPDDAARTAATHPENHRPEPTQAQKEAGNYKAGHLKLDGHDFTIETPAGAKRRPEWPALKNHYGYFKRTEGADGEHVDTFLGPHAQDPTKDVFVIDQVDPKTGKFDEHKVMYGFANGREARRAYRANYSKGWDGLGALHKLSPEEFKAWLKKPEATKKPVAEHVAEQGRELPPVQKGVRESKEQLAERARQAVEGGALGEKAAAKAKADRQDNAARSALEHHVTGAVERGEKEAITEQRGKPERAQNSAEKGEGTPSTRVAKWVQDQLAAGRKMNSKELFSQARHEWGGKQSEGKFTPKDAYDALELGVNQHILAHPEKYNPATADAAEAMRALEDLTELLPTQTKRTQEQDEFQQFSTVPAFAYLANWVANIRKGEHVLEPSAGIGGLAVFAKNAGAEVTVNELSPRRAEVLRELGFRTHTENAEQLHNVLPDDIKPTVVVMNPPFSATAGRVAGARQTMNGAKHIEAALARLEPGGRLVAIVGDGMAADKPRFQKWWAGIKEQYNVRANVGLPGDEYVKYGTTFDNQLLVIDKTGPQAGATITGKVATIGDGPALLDGIRNERQGPEATQDVQPAAAVGAGEGAPAGGEEAGAGVTAAPADAGAARAGQRAAGRGPGDEGAGDAGRVQPGDTGASVGRTGRGAAGRRAAAAAERAGRDAGESVGESDSAPAHADERIEPVPSPTAKDVKPAEDANVAGYKPAKINFEGAKPHPGKLTESAAMGAVQFPDATYTPNLPKSIITKGLLSDAQLETITYAGQAHQQDLPDGTRRGFFIGDGTGVGKGREISGIILDNMRQGKGKHVWLSEKGGLLTDAKRDFGGIGGDAGKLFAQGKTKAADAIAAKDGVLFTTYATLRSAEKKTANEKNAAGKTRMQQIVDWVGPDFDGVIAFDEAHNMGNAIAMKGKRGVQKPSAQALAGLELQKLLPRAKIVYVSATGATEVANLSYAPRLGLWGEKTSFATPENFIGEINKGGLAAMELVSRDMKQQGVYTARNLSYDGVTYGRLEHPLTPIQTEIYNELATAWQGVLQNVHQALDITEAKSNANAKSAALSAFWGSQQRFFNQVITAMQMPTVLQQARADMEAGHSVVLQLVNTNEAVQNRQIAARDTGGEGEGAANLEDLDLTPRENLIQYIKNSFPVQQFETVMDADGNKTQQPVVDSKGEPVFNKQAIAAREALIEKLGKIRVPDGPLEMVLNEFGHEAVAEVTGRTQRLIREKQDDGTSKTVLQRRSSTHARADADSFQAGKKKMLVFSDAGGTGFSFHADRTNKNQDRRMHYLVQPGWRADKAVQGFGRTHRTNQASAPHYYLPTTDLPAQKRFISSIARRLDQLGALTKGQRDAGSQGLMSAKDNLESEYAANAIYRLFKDLYHGKVEGTTFDEFTKQLGFDSLTDKDGGLNESKIPGVPQFLNRLLSLTTDQQGKVFEAFSSRLDAQVEQAILNGTLDNGMETLQADKVVTKGEQTVYTDPNTKAETKYVELELTQPTKLNKMPEANRYTQIDYYKNKTSGRVWAARDVGTTTKANGAVVERVSLVGPTTMRVEDKAHVLDAGKFEPLSAEDARSLWDGESKAAPKTFTEPAHLITGALLPIWDRLSGTVRVVRVATDSGEQYLGRYINKRDLPDTLKRLGANNSAASMKAPDVEAAVMKGHPVELSNGWRLEKRTVSGEPRIEVRNANMWMPGVQEELKRAGAFVERIEYQERAFFPAGEAGHAAIQRLIDTRPVAGVADGEATFAADGSRGDTGTPARVGTPAHTLAIAKAAGEIQKGWGANAPKLRVVDSAEKLPAYAKKHPDYRKAMGLYDPDTNTAYVVSGNLRDVNHAMSMVAHEVVGHHGVEHIMDAHVPGGWNRLVQDLGALRDSGKGSAAMRQVFKDVGRRYKDASPQLAAKETLAIMAEKGIRNGLINRVIAAVRSFVRKMFPNLKFNEADVLGLLTKSEKFLREGPKREAAPALRQAPAFAVAHDPDTPEFKRWFGASKVTTPDGEPRVLYHGTFHDFKQFDGREIPGWFSEDPKLSEAYASGAYDGDGGKTGEHIMPVYATVKNPLDLSNIDANDIRTPRMLYKEAGLEVPAKQEWRGDQADMIHETVNTTAFMEAAKAKGYDGVKIKERGYTTWAVFDPKQVKSATGNNGNYDPSNPDITQARAADPFYSALHESVQGMKGAPKAADAGAWKQWLDGAQRRGEFKQAEREWMGVDQFLEQHGGKVTREQLQDFVRDSQVKLEEKTLTPAGARPARPTQAELSAARSRLEEAGLFPHLDEDTGEYTVHRADGEPAYMTVEQMGDVSLLNHDTDANEGPTGNEAPGATKFAQYTLPGGENYREMLIRQGEGSRVATRNTEIAALEKRRSLAIDRVAEAKRQLEVGQGDEAELRARIRSETIERSGIDQQLEKLRTQGEQFTRGHFDESNVLAHVRLNDRVGPNGEKILHVEEVQSDWHQLGRKHGYRDEAKELPPPNYYGKGSIKEGTLRELFDPAVAGETLEGYIEARNELREAIRSGRPGGDDAGMTPVITPDTKVRAEFAGDKQLTMRVLKDDSPSRAHALARLQGRLDETNRSIREEHARNVAYARDEHYDEKKVPDAPFKKEWPMLAMKRVLREAAEGGYDAVTWTTGKQQAERYKLSKRVESIFTEVHDDNSGDRQVRLNMRDDGDMMLTVDKTGTITDVDGGPSNFSGKRLDDVIGKDMADQVMAVEHDRNFSGDQLDVGGDGMKGFYDKILPSELGKYAKQWGAKVGETRLEQPPKDEWIVRAKEGGAVFRRFLNESNARDLASQHPELEVVHKAAPGDALPVHSIDITPEMRASVLEGQPMFAADHAATAGLTAADMRHPDVSSEAARAWRDEGTSSPYFQRYFGKSKVVDAKGEPLVVHHGTSEGFTEFSDAHSGLSTGHMTAALGHFFAEDRGKAQRYAENASKGVPSDERVIDAYLSIQKPKEMKLADFLKIDDPAEARALKADLIRQGYDGIHMKEVGQWIAFKGEQIKSVENQGTFDPVHKDINFSLPEASIDAMEHVIAEPDGGILSRAKEWLRGKAENFRPAALGALQRRHLTELMDHSAPLKGYGKMYDERAQRLDAERTQYIAGAPDAAAHPKDMLKRGGATIAGDLQNALFEKGPGGWLGRRKPVEQHLARVMHTATIHGLDPSKEYTRLIMEDKDGRFIQWTPDAIKDRLKMLKEQMLGRSGDDKRAMLDERKALKALPGREKRRQEIWPKLVADYNAMPAEIKGLYANQRDWYEQHRDATEQALIKNVEALGRDMQAAGHGDRAKFFMQQSIKRIRLQFEMNRLEGVYFPLNRDGDYWIAVSGKDGAQGFKMFESAEEAVRAEKKLRAAGFTIDATGRRDTDYKAKNAPSGTFVADIIGILKKSGAPEKVQDQIYQTFLKTLPEMSMRKHSIHRKKVPGFDTDIVRSFSKNAFHGAHQLARLRNAHDMQAIVEAAQGSVDNFRQHKDSSTLETAKADALLAELKKRHDFIMSPKDTQLANVANSVGFLYYLGASPASAIVNLTQNAQVTLPVLGAHHGWAKATRMLASAVKDSLRTGGNIDRTLTTPEDRAAYQALRARGDIDKTQSHTLAGLAEGSTLTSNPVWARAMQGMSYLFHKAEVVNREAAGMAAFRLARSRGDAFNDAVQYASDIVNGTHFDYSASNRPRYMQGNAARAALQFKNYSVGMSWMMYRNLYQSFKGETPEVRSIARKTLTGILGVTAVMAGAMGIPLINGLRYAANAAHQLFGDDEEPWDFNTEFRGWLAEHLGDEASKLIADGAVNKAGAAISQRVSLSDLWFREADRDLEGKDAYYAALESIVGPLGGIAKNVYMGNQMISQGNVWRGVETMLPKFAKDAMKATRFAHDGANTLRGDPILPDVTTPESFIQALGFQPTRLFEQQRTNRALKNYEQSILDRRQSLMNAYAMAVRAGDDRDAAMAKIHAFNAKYPEIALKAEGIRQSLRARARYTATSDNGIFLNRKLKNRVVDEVGAPE